MSLVAEWFQQGKNLSLAELKEAEKSFRDLDMPAKEELWKELHTFFLKAPLAADRKYRYSYFRWYTQLTWSSLYPLDEEIVSSIVFARQLPVAVLLGYDPVYELLVYLNSSPYSDESMPLFYGKIRDGVLKSGAIVGNAKGREVTGADLVKELMLINQNKDTLRQAEFTARLKDVLLPKSDEQFASFLFATGEEAVAFYMNALSFFIATTPDAIWPLVKTAFQDDYFGPPGGFTVEKNDRSATADTVPTIVPSSQKKAVIEQALPTKTQRTAPTESPVSSLKKTVPPVQITPQASTPSAVSSMPSAETHKQPLRPTNREIRDMVEALFPADSSLNDEDRLAKIINVLDTLAIRYGDETIREAYYFNAETGRFEWLD